ncbi:type VI secretion system protein TssA [Ruegeria jejuensis]|uniref:type VI secretion system protein TssA n=1 Tax=Ruegeria jejuensis TaxID=3233338 RepID=UPI00355BBDF2
MKEKNASMDQRSPAEPTDATEEIAMVGENPRVSEGAQELYRRLRDSRSAARLIERKLEISEGALLSFMPAQKEWAEVRQLAIEILSNYAKDVEIAVWLIESETRLDGFEGLARSIRLMDDMVAAFGTTLHPRPEDPDDDTFAALAGLNGSGRPGALLQPLRLLPLIPGGSYGEATLWDVQNGNGEEEVRDAMRRVGSAAMQGHLDQIERAALAIRDLDTRLSALRGADAPTFTQINDILDDAARTVRRLAVLEETVTIAPEKTAAQDTKATPRTGAIATREDAFNRLLEVAVYFREAEPHSPIADALETLVRRGRMDFVSLLKELIPDDHARQAVLTTAGIKTQDPGEEAH